MLSVPGPSDHGIELGAQVVHGSRAPTHPLLAELGVATRVIPQGEFLDLGADGVLRPVDAQRQAATVAAFLAASQAYRGADISARAMMAEMGLSDAQRSWLARDPLSYAAEPDEISLFSLWDYGPTWGVLEDANYQVVGGYGGVADRLGRGLGSILRLNTRVERIDWRAGRVRVHARTPAGAERFNAAAVVVTLPLSILKAGHVGFAPALPDWKVQALGRLGMGRVVVQQMTFARDFWSERLAGASGWQMDNGRVTFTAPHGPDAGPPALSAWVTGRATESLAGLAPAAVQDQILNWIDTALPGSNVTRLRRWVALKDWQRERFSLGANSYTRPGGRYARGQLATPLKGSVFFAGEATIGAPDYQTVHGAYLTGLRAAREVIAQL
jgi:monoamine oxidase